MVPVPNLCPGTLYGSLEGKDRCTTHALRWLTTSCVVGGGGGGRRPRARKRRRRGGEEGVEGRGGGQRWRGKRVEDDKIVTLDLHSPVAVLPAVLPTHDEGVSWVNSQTQ